MLTDDEKEEALRVAREAKYFSIKRQEYNEKIRKQAMHKKYTSSELFGIVSKSIEIDAENTNVVQALCKYFAGDESFIGDLNKGLFIMGTVGVGKTTLMLFFQANQIFSYRIESCRQIEQKISEEGEEYLRTCSYNITGTNENSFGHTERGFCFDDLGTEDNSKHYGKERNVMAEIILNRYDNRLPYTSTHITTNLTGQQIKEKYGSRVTDRLKEMFNIIQFDPLAKSRRK